MNLYRVEVLGNSLCARITMNQSSDEITFVEPEFAPWDGRRVPVVLLGGYLGAGKTTLINELLARTDVPIAVMVNDVGETNIDAALIERHGTDTLDLTGGCVCCSLKNGFLEAFDDLRSKATPPELVVVELSGVADPINASGLVSTAGFQLDSIVTLVDIEQFDKWEAEDSVVAGFVRTQVKAADVVLLTKQDLVDNSQIEKVKNRVSELAKDATLLLADSIHSAAGLVGLSSRRPIPQIGVSRTLFDQHRVSTLPLPEGANEQEINLILDDLPSTTVRAKGIARAADGELLLIQVTGKRRVVEPLPVAEITDPTDLVVIEAG